MQDISKSYLEARAGILPRRYGIKNKIFLYGAPGVGKSALAFLHSIKYKNTLYINCADWRTNIESANQLILKSYLERKLELLIIDDYTSKISLPNFKNTILIGNSKAQCSSTDFIPKHIRGLSFEEYVSFDNKNQSIDYLFKAFLKEGNLPRTLFLPTHLKTLYKQEMLKLSLWNDFPIFRSLLSLQGQKLSIHHIYTILKKSHKISKDRIYSLLHSLADRGIIYLLPHTKHPYKKLYFYDFALPLCSQNDKNLQAMLENMLLLELFLFCERYGTSTDISYGDMGELICELGVFIFLPFANEQNLTSKLTKLKESYKHVHIITFDFEGKGKIGSKSSFLTWSATNFINFALEFSV